jgi:ammonia channel protein AmtB
METNVGSTDKTVRILVGAVAGIVSLATLAGAISLPSVASLVLGIVAVLMLGTAFTSKCALYSVLGVDTR